MLCVLKIHTMPQCLDPNQSEDQIKDYLETNCQNKVEQQYDTEYEDQGKIEGEGCFGTVYRYKNQNGV